MISLPPGLTRQESLGKGQTMSTTKKEGQEPTGTVPLRLLHSTTHTHYSFINLFIFLFLCVFS